MRMHYMHGLLKYTMTDDLELLISEMAQHQAHHHQNYVSVNGVKSSWFRDGVWSEYSPFLIVVT